MTDLRKDEPGARDLPDEYASLGSPPRERVLELVARRWGDRPDGERRQLAQVLMAILAPLDQPGARVTEEVRRACEQMVADWIRTTIPVRELVRSAPTRQSPRRTTGGQSLQRRVVRLVSADLIQDGADSVARVTLGRSATRFTRTTPTGADLESQLKDGAELTLSALREAVPAAGLRLVLRNVGTFEGFEEPGVIVAVAVTLDESEWTVLGVCAEMGGNPVKAAALAVLNSTNRVLGIG